METPQRHRGHEEKRTADERRLTQINSATACLHANLVRHRFLDGFIQFPQKERRQIQERPSSRLRPPKNTPTRMQQVHFICVNLRLSAVLSVNLRVLCVFVVKFAIREAPASPTVA